MKNKLLIFSIFVVGISIIILCFIPLYNLIFKPAYISALSDCRIINESEINSLGYYRIGSYTLSNDSIKINTPKYDSNNKISPYYAQTLKHEECHKKQIKEGRLNSCWVNRFGFPFGIFINEVECYYKQYS